MVNVPFTVNSLNTFSVLLGPNMLLDDFGGGLSADLSVVCQLPQNSNYLPAQERTSVESGLAVLLKKSLTP